jgi:lipid-binding SYLF domain-containing protein
MRTSLITSLLYLSAVVLTIAGCSSYKTSQAGTTPPPSPTLHDEVQAAVASFKRKDPSIQRFFANAYGYAVFPNVSKGGLGIGGAYGKGEVYEQNNLVGYTSLTQGTIGLQIGGQVYSEIIFFKSQANLESFKRGNFEFSAQASAVAATAGASANADFAEGIAVFTLAKSGFMGEAAIGGQKFSYVPK